MGKVTIPQDEALGWPLPYEEFQKLPTNEDRLIKKW